MLRYHQQIDQEVFTHVNRDPTANSAVDSQQAQRLGLVVLICIFAASAIKERTKFCYFLQMYTKRGLVVGPRNKCCGTPTRHKRVFSCT